MTTYYPPAPAVVKRMDASTVFVDPSGGGDPAHSVRVYYDAFSNPAVGVFNTGITTAMAALGSVGGQALLALQTGGGVTNTISASQLGVVAPIGSLTPAANDVLQYKSGAWTNRTMAQLATDLTTLATVASPSFTGNGLFTLATSAGTVAVKVSGNAANSVVLGTVSSSGAITFGDGTNPPDVGMSRTGANAMTLTGVVTMTSPVISGHATIEGITPTGATGTGNLVFSASPTFTGTPVFPTGQVFLSSAASLVWVWDATTTNGKITLGTGNVGVPVGNVSVYADSTHSSAVIAMLNVNGLAELDLGPGSSAADVKLARTGAAAATLTGQVTVATGLTMGSGINVATNTTTGTIFAVTSSQKIGFWGTTAVARGSAFTQTYSTASHTHTQTAMTDPAAYAAGANGYSTAAMAQAIHAEVIALKANMVVVQNVVNAIIDDLQLPGLLA